MESLYRQLDQLFHSLPGVPCIAGCTQCCVSPHITGLEFCRSFDWCTKNFNEEEFNLFLRRPTLFHPQFEGNLRCRFHREDGFCGIHPGRPLACRLHGLPVIEQMGIANLENCTIMPRHSLPQVDLSLAQGWLRQLVDLNQFWYADAMQNEYGLKALNIECWIDLLFGRFDLDPVLELQEKLRHSLPEWNKWAKDYKPLSSLAEKLDAIYLLKMSMDGGDLKGLKELAIKIRDGFQNTGTWYREELDTLILHIEKTGN